MAMQSGKEASANSERLWREQLLQMVERTRNSGRSRSHRSSTPSQPLGCCGSKWPSSWSPPTSCPALPLAWSIPLGILLVLLMGLRMNAFGVILHEGSHGLLAKSRTLNDRICNWGIAFWTINSVEEYRPTHRLHHRYLGQERDPDRVFYLVPARRGALTSLLLQDLFGVTAFRRATSRISGTSEASGAPVELAGQAAAAGGQNCHAIDSSRAVRPLSGGPPGSLVLRGLLARADRLHVPDDPPFEDDHRALRSGTCARQIPCTGSPGPAARGGCRITSWGRGWSTTSSTTSFPPFRTGG